MMTLHEAIELVLHESGRVMQASAIADSINNRGLYRKSDNSPISGNQVHARVAKYPGIFETSEDGISLVDIGIKAYKQFTRELEKLLTYFFPAKSGQLTDIISHFLVLIYYQGHFTQIFTNRIHSPKGFLISLFQKLENEHHKLENCFRSTTDFISNSLSENEVEQILHLLENFSFNSLERADQEDFSQYFNDYINFFTGKSKTQVGEFSTPKELAALMCAIYEPPYNGRVFDPFAGNASLLNRFYWTNKDRFYDIIAGDIVQDTYILGKLNLYTTGSPNYSYERRNALTDWRESVNADIVISNPPFTVKANTEHYYADWQKVPSNNLRLNAIQLALHHMNERGKCILVVPETVLVSAGKDAAALRQILVKEDWLQGVILLPRSLFKPYTSSSSALIILDKSRKSRSTGIFFYDATELQKTEFSKEIPFIIDAFHGESTLPDKAIWVSSKEIEEQDYVLNAKQYLLHPPDGSEYVQLRDLLTDSFLGIHIPSEIINNESGVPYIQTGNLSDGEGLGSINMNELKVYISDIDDDKLPPKLIPKGSVLVAKAGGKLKPTIYQDSREAVASSNIIVLCPNYEILPEYLVAQLQSEYLVKQVESIRRYTAMPTFNLKDLLKLKIRMLPVEKQQQYVATFYSKKIYQTEQAAISSKEDGLYNIISRIKHEVKQPVSAIGNDITALTDYLQQKADTQQPISLTDFTVTPLPGQSAADMDAAILLNVLNRIKKCVDEAQTSLTKAEETLNLGAGNLKIEPVAIRQLIEADVKPLYRNAGCNIQVKGKEYTINADCYQIKILFRNLIDNAIQHGFTPKLPDNDDTIIFELKNNPKTGFIEITVMNNGRPFGVGFNTAFFETKGKTGMRDRGSGFGGFHIKQIIENHKGQLIIPDEAETGFSDFKVRFKICLPANINI
jgi:type I restriction enzyme M protein